MGKRQRRAVSAEDRVQKVITAPALEDGGKKVPAKYPGKGLLEDEPRGEVPKVEAVEKRGLWGSAAGKTRVASRVVAKIPEHKTYVEPFAGGAAVFFAKEPSENEVLADLNSEVAFSFCFVRDVTKAQVEALRRKNWMYSKDRLKAAHELKLKGDVDRFYRFVFKRWATFFGSDTRITAIDPSKDGKISTIPKRIEGVRDRLKGVVVRNSDYEKVVREFDSKATFFYFDPPFPGFVQEVGEKDFDEARFVRTLKGLKGKFLLHYDAKAKVKFQQKGWKTSVVEVVAAGPQGTKPGKLLEVSNYEQKAVAKAPEETLKRAALAPGTDPEDLTTLELLKGHDRLHLTYRAKAHAPKFVKGWSVEDIVNMHALIVGELLDRKKEHPPPPDDGLDEISEDFERVEKRYAVVRSSGVEEGKEIKLDDVLSHFESFKIRKPYVYLVGGLANHGKTKGDIDILVKDSEKLPEAFKHVVHFRLGRALPSELAERLSIHYDKYHGPFTKHVPLYDLTLEAIPKREVVEMRAEGED